MFIRLLPSLLTLPCMKKGEERRRKEKRKEKKKREEKRREKKRKEEMRRGREEEDGDMGRSLVAKGAEKHTRF